MASLVSNFARFSTPISSPYAAPVPTAPLNPFPTQDPDLLDGDHPNPRKDLAHKTPAGTPGSLVLQAADG